MEKIFPEPSFGENGKPDFDSQKTQYFSDFAVKHREYFKLHRDYGVLNKAEGWRNVSEHCLLEAVTADILAEGLGLAEEEREQLVAGAILHDFFKRRQMEMLRASGGSVEALEASERESDKVLDERGYPNSIVRIARSAADFRRMMDPDVSLSERIMNYVDNITINNRIGSVDERVDRNEANPAYQKINEAGREFFGGLTESQAQRKFGKEIQRELSHKLGINDPDSLPQWIGQRLTVRIEKSR